MRNAINREVRSGERGAVSIKAVLSTVVILIIVFVLIKIVPVYVEQRQITFQADELANKISVRMPKQEEIDKSIERLRKEYELPAAKFDEQGRLVEGIALTSFQQNSAQITLGYIRNIDLLVTTYEWKVDYTAKGKAL